MKKLISLTLAIMLILSLAVPALADTTVTDTSAKQTGETKVTYEYKLSAGEAAYTVIIPGSVQLAVDEEAQATATVEAKNVLIGVEKTLTVNISAPDANGKYQVMNGTVALDYTVTNGDADSSITTANTQILAVGKEGTTTPDSNGVGYADSTTLTFSNLNTEDITVAGEYAGTLTFTVAVTPADSTT